MHSNVTYLPFRNIVAPNSGLSLARSTFAAGRLNDRVIDTAVTRFGPHITDAVVIVSSDVVLSPFLEERLDGLKEGDAASRLDRLSQIAERDPSYDETAIDPQAGSDFQILRLGPKFPRWDPGVNLRQYAFFQEGMPPAALTGVDPINSVHGKMRNSYLERVQEFLRGVLDDMSGPVSRDERVGMLSLAKGLAVMVEAGSDSMPSGVACDFDLIWGYLGDAHRALISGGAFPSLEL